MHGENIVNKDNRVFFVLKTYLSAFVKVCKTIMKEPACSKKIKERQEVFPWFKIFFHELVTKFPNGFEEETLQFLLQNINEEVKSLSNSKDEKRNEALFETIYDLFPHFWWRFRWKGRKKWTRYWKNVSSEVPYTFTKEDEHSKCCEKLLYYIIYLGIILSNGYSDSDWIGKVFEAIHILPRFDAMVYNSLLCINDLEKKYHLVYIAVLKHVLCTEVAENISDPIIYIKIIMLFRRLVTFTEDKIAISALKSTASNIKPPSDTQQWLSSLEIGFYSKHRNIATALLSKKCPNNFVHKLQQVITESVDCEQKAHSEFPDQSEKIDKLNDKHKPILHKLHSKAKLKESAALQKETVSACSNRSPNAEININFKNKRLTCIKASHKPINLNRVEVLKKKKKCPKDKSIVSKAKVIDCPPSVSMESNMNEFLNLSFAEIGNFSKSFAEQHQEVLSLSKSKNVMKKDVLLEENDSSIHLFNENISRSNHKRKQAKFCNVSKSNKRIKLNSNERNCSKIQSVQKLHSSSSVTLNSNEITCLNSQDTVRSNNPQNVPVERSTQETLDCTSQWFDSDPCNTQRQDCIGIATTSEICNPIKEKILLDKSPHVSLVDIKNLQTSDLLKLVQPLNVDFMSSLHCEVSPRTLIENDSRQFDIDWNDSNDVMAGNESPSVLQASENSKHECEVCPNSQLKNNDTSQNYACENSNIAIATSESSNFILSTKKVNGNINQSVETLSNCKDQPTKKHRLRKKKLLIPTANKSLDSSQKISNNSAKRSSSLNSELVHSSSSITQTNDRAGNVCITQKGNTSHCVIDCKVVNDYVPNNSNNNATTSSVKVIINVRCKTPEECVNQQEEHIFGNFNKNTKDTGLNTYENIFNSLNPFCESNSILKMPKLLPYDDPLFLTRSMDAIATPPDSELEISTPGPLKRDKIGTPIQFSSKKSSDKSKCTSTPKGASNAVFGSSPNNDLDTTSPNTSECETLNEWSLENTNLTNSISLINSLRKSPVANILERSDYYSTNSTPVKKASPNAAKNVSYRCNANTYSHEDLSDASKVSGFSRISSSDEELNCSFTNPTNYGKCKEVSQQKIPKVLRPSQFTKKCPDNEKLKHPFTKPTNHTEGKDVSPLTKVEVSKLDSSFTSSNRYNLRPRKSFVKPAKLNCTFQAK